MTFIPSWTGLIPPPPPPESALGIVTYPNETGLYPRGINLPLLKSGAAELIDNDGGEAEAHASHQ